MFHERPLSANADVSLPNIELNQSGNENVEHSKEDYEDTSIASKVSFYKNSQEEMSDKGEVDGIENPATPRLRDKSTLQPPQIFSDFVMSSDIIMNNEPSTYEEAMKSEYTNERKLAID